MIVVKVELWPFGIEERKREIGSFTIANVGPSPEQDNNQVCSYKYRFKTAGKPPRKKWKEGVIHGFPRLRRNVYDLIYRALKDAVGDRNEGT